MSCEHFYNWTIAISAHSSKKTGLPNLSKFKYVVMTPMDKANNHYTTKTFRLSKKGCFQYSETEKQLLFNYSHTFDDKKPNKVKLKYVYTSSDSVTLTFGAKGIIASEKKGIFKGLKVHIIRKRGGSYIFEWKK